MARIPSSPGLLIVYTGGGKGKTTAAVGTAIRAAGHGMRILFGQFMKGDIASGEERSLKKLGRRVKYVKAPTGFYGIGGDKRTRGEHVRAARELLALLKHEMLTGKYGLVVLDEANVVASLKLLRVKDLVEFARSRPTGCHVVMTGRNAPKTILKMADLVTEMKEVKHPFKKGVGARKGIEL